MTKPKYDPEFTASYNDWKESKERYMRNKERSWFAKKEKEPKPPRESGGIGELLLRTRRNTQFVLIFGGVMVILAVCAMHFLGNDIGFTTTMLILGSCLFMPLGLAFGIFMGDTFKMCKLMRSMTKKNYGVMNYISSDGRNILYRKIVNLSGDVLDQGKEGIWRITKGRIFQEKGEVEGQSWPIKGSNMGFTVGVPCIYVDANSLEPLSFWQDEKPIPSQELTSIMRAYLLVQQTNMLNKKTQMIMILLIGCLIFGIVCAGLDYLNYDFLQNKASPQLGSISRNSDSTNKIVQQGNSITNEGG